MWTNISTYQLTHSYIHSNTDVPLTYHIRIYYTAYKRYFAPKIKIYLLHQHSENK
jgi:hypothetical protein